MLAWDYLSARKHTEELETVRKDENLINQSTESRWEVCLAADINNCAQLIASGGNMPTHCTFDHHVQTTERVFIDSKLRENLRVSLSRASCQVSCIRFFVYYSHSACHSARKEATKKFMPTIPERLPNTHTHTARSSADLDMCYLQVCKTLISAHKDYLASCKADGAERDFIRAIIPGTDAENAPEPMARCVRILLAAVRQACTSGSTLDPRRVLMCAALVAAEELPQAARWHRRDLAPGLIAAWRAALAVLSPPRGTRTAARVAALPRCREG
jgi:hypothetical protein